MTVFSCIYKKRCFHESFDVLEYCGFSYWMRDAVLKIDRGQRCGS